jgi:hypothetical protein
MRRNATAETVEVSLAIGIYLIAALYIQSCPINAGEYLLLDLSYLASTLIYQLLLRSSAYWPASSPPQPRLLTLVPPRLAPLKQYLMLVPNR